jgi:hypothetical protein
MMISLRHWRSRCFAVLMFFALAVPFSRAATVTLNAPNYDWYYGCSPTSAGMLMGYYDRNGYNGYNYARLVPGGMAELNSFTGAAPLAEAAMASSEHVNSFFIGGYGSGNVTGDDNVSGRTLPQDYNCLADFMGTSQDYVYNPVGTTTFTNNPNGSTTFYNYTNGVALNVGSIEAFGASVYNDSGAYGLYEYLSYRGYGSGNPADYDIFNQYRLGYNGTTSGFTWNNYKTEIDAGRPVLIHVEGHTMLGMGYNDTGGAQTVYLHDTWTTGLHTMTWGGSYSGMTHVGVTVVRLPVGDLDFMTDADGGSAHIELWDDGFSEINSLTGLPAGSIALDSTWDISAFNGGTDGWGTYLFYYDPSELTAKGILSEENLRPYWWDDASWAAGYSGTFYTGTPQGGLGDYGVDLDDNYVWVNVNHASTWGLFGLLNPGVPIPEPGTVAALGLATLSVSLLRRRSRG